MGSKTPSKHLNINISPSTFHFSGAPFGEAVSHGGNGTPNSFENHWCVEFLPGKNLNGYIIIERKSGWCRLDQSTLGNITIWSHRARPQK